MTLLLGQHLMKRHAGPPPCWAMKQASWETMEHHELCMQSTVQGGTCWYRQSILIMHFWCVRFA